MKIKDTTSFEGIYIKGQEQSQQKRQYWSKYTTKQQDRHTFQQDSHISSEIVTDNLGYRVIRVYHGGTYFFYVTGRVAYYGE